MQGSLLKQRYQLLQPLGQGGFGQTYLAADTQRPQHPQCVVKQLQVQPASPGASISPAVLAKAKQLFDQEAETLEKLGTHEQIPQLLAYFEQNQQFYLVQELVKGNPLSQELMTGHKFSEAEVFSFLQDTLQVLAFVHRANVIHRDIKPANLMRRQADGKIVLIDFGAVKEIRSLSVHSNNVPLTVAIGTRGYMPNEQANGRPQLNSDVYAVGILAIQALTGLNPDPKAGGLPQDSKTGEISWRHLATVSDELAKIIDKMIRQDYRQRYVDAAEALKDILGLSNPTVQQTAVSLPASSGTNPTIQSNKSIAMSILNWPRDHKLGFAALIVGIIGVMVAAFTVPEIRAVFGLDRVKDEVYQQNGIILKYPGDWQEQQPPQSVGGDRAIFQSPKEDSSDPYQENITLKIIDLSLTPQEYYQQKLRPKLELDYNINLPNTANSTTLGDRDGNTIMYITTENGIEIQHQAIWTVKNGTVYQITYSGERANFPSDQQTVIKKVQDSFKIP
jgi:serine/threonine protein kinase